jgi:hypothetical protein
MPEELPETTDLVIYSDLEAIGQVAGEYAAQETFGEYQGSVYHWNRKVG